MDFLFKERGMRELKTITTKDLRYREIIENWCINDNLKTLFLRAVIRYVVRTFGFSHSCKILGSINKIKLSKRSKYILEINILNIEAIKYLMIGNAENYVDKKREINRYVLKNSEDINQVSGAEYYESLFSDKKIIKSKSIGNKYKFFIYGPNAKDPPLLNEGEILVLTKFPKFETSHIKNKMLFLNNWSTIGFNKEDLKRLTESYEKVYVTWNSNLNTDFNHKIIKSPESEYASLMGLQRILFHLRKEYEGNIDLRLMGFDLYSSPSSYEKNLATGTPDNFVGEKAICRALMHHDPVYNFLFLKKFSEEVEIDFDEYAVKKLLELNHIEYLRKIIKIRKFDA